MPPTTRIGIMLCVLFWGGIFSRALEGQEGVYLTEEEAPQAVFPEGESFAKRVVPVTDGLRTQIQARLGALRPSRWEEAYTTFTVGKGGALLGYAVIVEEIGKHRPITMVVGVRPDGTVQDVAVMVYREPQGGEVKNRRFLAQYAGREETASLVRNRDIRNITGATLSVDAMNRGVKKALAVVGVCFLSKENP